MAKMDKPSGRSSTAVSGFSNGWRLFGVEEAAAVGPQHLDRFPGTRPGGPLPNILPSPLPAWSDRDRAKGSCSTPAETRKSAKTKEMGKSKYTVARIRSTQKLPRVFPPDAPPCA